MSRPSGAARQEFGVWLEGIRLDRRVRVGLEGGRGMGRDDFARRPGSALQRLADDSRGRGHASRIAEELAFYAETQRVSYAEMVAYYAISSAAAS